VLRAKLLTLLAVMLCLLPAYGQPEGALDEFGGLVGPRRAATGFFRVTKAEGRWWLVDPNGCLFLSVGANGVSLGAGSDRTESTYREAALAKHRSESAWAQAAVKQLREWGFNTVGADSDAVVREQEMVFTVSLNCSRAVRWAEGQLFPDVFDPDYQRAVQRQAARACSPYADSRWLLGYFTDEQLDWGTSGAGSETLIGQFLGLEDQAPGRRALLRFLEERYLNILELDQAWATSYASFEEIGRTPQVGSHIPQADADGFQQLVAGEYFRIADDAIRAVDKHHLVLGPRFDGEVPGPVLAAMNGHVSVVSVASSTGKTSPEHLRQIQRAASCPVLICDFAVAVSSAETRPRRLSWECAETEEEQAARYQTRVREMMALPMVIGCHWHSYVDEQMEGGRGQCGLVGLDDEPHGVLVAAAAKANSDVYRSAAVRQKEGAAGGGAGGR